MSKLKKTQQEKRTSETKQRRGKQETIEQEIPKNPREYSYFGDEIIEIPAHLFLMLYRANDAAIAQGTKGYFPTAVEWVSAATGMKVDKPSAEDISSGKVVQSMSVEGTFNRDNFVESFEPWLYPDIIKAKELMLSIHSENVRKGVASKLEDIQKRHREMQQNIDGKPSDSIRNLEVESHEVSSK